MCTLVALSLISLCLSVPLYLSVSLSVSLPLSSFSFLTANSFQGIVKEAIAFFRYAIALFNQDFLQVKASQHLHHYVQRVALSVLLPIRAPPLSPPPTPSIVVESVPDMGTFPRKKEKRELTEIGFRRRGQTVHGDPSQGPSNQVLLQCDCLKRIAITLTILRYTN